MKWNAKSIFSIIPLLSVLIFGCRKDKDEIVNLTGLVIDQVTLKPVSGATVYFAGSIGGEEGIELINNGYQAISDNNGNYNVKIPKSVLEDDAIINSTLYPRIYAMKYGFAGSSYHSVYNNYNNTIELFHPAKLILRIWNDTLNNVVDEIEVGIVAEKYRSYPGAIGRMLMCTPITRKKCSGRDFDAIFEFYPLWGNMPYELHFGTWCHSVAKFTIIPDSTLYYSIAF